LDQRFGKKKERELTDNCVSIQSLLRMREPSLVLRCREADRGLVEAVLEVAKKEYAEKAKVNLPKVIVDGKVYLPPYKNTRNAHGPSW
jgi:V-type H+-transporting ATPase subunit E